MDKSYGLQTSVVCSGPMGAVYPTRHPLSGETRTMKMDRRQSSQNFCKPSAKWFGKRRIVRHVMECITPPAGNVYGHPGRNFRPGLSCFLGAATALARRGDSTLAPHIHTPAGDALNIPNSAQITPGESRLSPHGGVNTTPADGVGNNGRGWHSRTTQTRMTSASGNWHWGEAGTPCPKLDRHPDFGLLQGVNHGNLRQHKRAEPDGSKEA